MKRTLKIIGVGILILIFILFLGINKITYRATGDINLVSYKNIVVDENKDYLSIIPENRKNLPNIIFYNGALVESKAYLRLGIKLAEKGFSVYLLKTTVNLPVLNMGKASKIAKELDEPFILMGHSLGGVIAAQDANKEIKNPNLKGLVLLSSYPMKKTDLSKVEFPVLSISATKDYVFKSGEMGK